MHHASVNATLAQQHRNQYEAEAVAHRRIRQARTARRAAPRRPRPSRHLFLRFAVARPAA